MFYELLVDRDSCGGIGVRFISVLASKNIHHQTLTLTTMTINYGPHLKKEIKFMNANPMHLN